LTRSWSTLPFKIDAPTVHQVVATVLTFIVLVAAALPAVHVHAC
jgi:hypothetical protein